MENILIRHWWILLVFAAISYFASYILSNYIDILTAPFGVIVLKYFSYFLVFATIILFFRTRQRKNLLSSQTGLESIRALSWRNFEDLITEAYKQNGFRIKREPIAGSDGGVDIKVEKDSRIIIIQCKQWRLRKLGVKIVREMFGILSGSDAEEVHIVTTGRITSEALSFARGKPIKIIYGRELLNLISEAQKNTTNKNKIESTNVCPVCGSEMVLRIARKGNNTGSKFWGCVQFPKCRGTASVSS